MPESRSLASGRTPWEVLAGEVGRLRRDVADLRSTVLARPNRQLTGWITPTLAGAWANYDADRILQYMRTADGWVRMRGLVKDGTGVITTLPAGFRPENRVSTEHHFPVVANGAFGYVAANRLGEINLFAGSNVWVDLSTVTYKAV